jgi:hypothetical protein
METAEETRSSAGIGIMVVVIATGIRAVLIVLALLVDRELLQLDWMADVSPIPLYPIGTALGLISRGLLIALLIASILSVVGLSRRNQWGWTLSIVTAGAILALNIGWWAGGQPHYVSMLLNAIAVFYLNQRDLRTVFQVGEQ